MAPPLPNTTSFSIAIALVVAGICSAAASSAGSKAEIPAALKNRRRVKAVMAGKV
jgi:hypothetical protein